MTYVIGSDQSAALEGDILDTDCLQAIPKGQQASQDPPADPEPETHPAENTEHRDGL
jgi:hypothetical protein